MKQTLQVINQLEKEGIIKTYAMGGATALLFYTEPALTFDIDIFIFLPESQQKNSLINLSPLYQALEKKGYSSKKEHILIEGIAVQFIPAYNALVTEAVQKATKKNYEVLEIKVLSLEYLLAIMLDTNRPKDRERINYLIKETNYSSEVLRDILKDHSLIKKWENNFGKI
ncbi:MAG: hypothetical protein KDK66_04730 [Deltaproteobacteria bacterium]|nr:hypothetical protein [Deltaproteobacteria bacterium]